MLLKPHPDRPLPPLPSVHDLTEDDLSAAEALADAMSGWKATELAAYRTAVEAELAALGANQLHGFLAVEVAALQVVGAPLN